jgi:hypothetical protein
MFAMKIHKGLSLGWVLILTACSPVMPDTSADKGLTTSVASSEAGGNKVLGAPGPVAGVGLPLMVLVGGVVWIMSRKERRDRLQK